MLDIVRHDFLGVAKLSLRGALVFGPDTAELLATVNDVLNVPKLGVVCDLSKVDDVDSSGLAALVMAQEAAHRADRHFVWLRPGARLRTMIQTARLAPLIDTAETETDAIRRALEWRPVPRRPGVTGAATVRLDQAHLGEDDE
jgi:anti-anti-sigma regulatory factor